MAENQIATVRYTHEAIIDQIIADPAISGGELAKRFGYTQTWISIIINSDAFKERLAERRGVLVDPKLSASIEDRLAGIASKSLDKIIERLDNSAGGIKNLELVAMAKLGVGERQLQANNVQQNNLYVVSMPQPAENAKSWMETVQGGPRSSPMPVAERVEK